MAKNDVHFIILMILFAGRNDAENENKMHFSE
jgi:hypothetical protein